jgi:hypothetical protein
MKMENRSVLGIDDANKYLFDKVLENKPFFVSRIGLGELIRINIFLNGYPLRQRIRHMRGLGIKDSLSFDRRWKKFAPLYYQAYLTGDIQCVWIGDEYLKMQSNLLARCSKDVVAIDSMSVEPYYSKYPWTAALEGKKVLVVSPFVDDFFRQYSQRQKIWPIDKKILPEFELLCYKSNFYFDKTDDYAEVYHKMSKDISGFNFDIALLSCGAVGLLLGRYIREDLQKSSVYMGGALQILFGVKGARWETHPVISTFFNESWIRSSSESSTSGKVLDNSCYW